MGSSESLQQSRGLGLDDQGSDVHRVVRPRVYYGVDNGVSGAVARISQDGVLVYPTPTRSTGGDTRIDANALYLKFIHPRYADLFVVYEQGQKQPKFGVKGNFANGRSDGVIETVVELLGVPYRPVNPKTWQKDVFAGVRNAFMDTKAAAKEFCRRTFPDVDLRRTPRCKGPDDNMADALCMAWWCKNVAFRE